MSSTTDREEIERCLKGWHKRMPTMTRMPSLRPMPPDAVIFDLAPPLGRRGMNRDNVAAWLAGWHGPIQIDACDVSLTVDGDLAFVSALNRMRGRQGGNDQALWYRMTMCLQRMSGRWQIVCDHSSVPFYMDGSYRPAVDLKPNADSMKWLTSIARR